MFNEMAKNFEDNTADFCNEENLNTKRNAADNFGEKTYAKGPYNVGYGSPSVYLIKLLTHLSD